MAYQASALPLSYAGEFTALTPVQVSKNTVCDISVQVSSMLFDTPGFFTHYKKCFSSPGTPSFAVLSVAGSRCLALKEKPWSF